MVVKDIPIAVYFQIANIIKNQILTHELTPGAKLPTENQMAEKYDVSRLTVRKALGVLIEENLVYSIRGSGTYVTDADKWKPRPIAEENFEKWLQERVELPLRIHEYAMVSNTETISKNLQNPDDKFIFRISGVNFSNEQPLMYPKWHIPYDLGRKIPMGGLDEGPFIPQFERFTKVKVKEGLRSLYPGRATRTEAEFLGVKEGDLVLVGEAVFVDETDRPILYVSTRYKEDFRYNIRVVRA